MTNWQPIETAPDGPEPMLLYDPDVGVLTGTRDSHSLTGWMDSRGHGYEWDVWGNGEIEPTHWMPLPEPPEVGHE